VTLKTLQYPLESDSLFKTLAIGTVLIIASIFIIPWFIIIGFYMKVINHSSQGKEIPTFGNYVDLLINGLKYAVVSLIYGIGVVIFIMVVSLIGEINAILSIISLLLIFVAYSLYVYLLPAIMYEFAQEYKIEDAFNFSEILGYVKSIEYLKIALLLSLVYPILFALLQVGVGITIIGLIFIPATIIYEMMVYGHLVSKVGNIKK